MQPSVHDTPGEVAFADYSRAILNILDDSASERDRLNDAQRAVVNILEDLTGEKSRLEATQRAVLNILDDFTGEKERLEQTKKAVLNILDDFAEEKKRLQEVQKAMLNILADFDEEKTKVEAVNSELRREIEERLAVERALRSKSTALARSNADLEQFAYVASHDLQEPLRMVSSYVQLLSKRYDHQLDEQARKYIAYAVGGAQRMQALIAALLEYSRVSRNDEAPSLVSAEASKQRALNNLRAVIAETGARIFDETLPDVMGNAPQLTQVFQNLIGNALKFHHAGQTPEVRIGFERRESSVVFHVSDNGIGIDTRYVDRIFAIFQRLHTRSEYPGTGIGLAICKNVIERNGGRIWVESQAGCGSTFYFSARGAREDCSTVGGPHDQQH